MQRLPAVLCLWLSAGVALALSGLQAGCRPARSMQSTPVPSKAIRIAAAQPAIPVPTVVPTKAVPAGALAIPGNLDTVTLTECHGGRLYISSDENGCGLHCFSLADLHHLWSAHFADYQHHICEEGQIKQATAYRLAFSADGTTLFAGVSGEETCEPQAIKLVALDCATGKQLSEFEDSEYRALTVASLGGREILIAVGSTNVLVLDQANLATILLKYDAPHRTPDTKDLETLLLLDKPGCSAWDAASGVLYFGMPADKRITRLELLPTGKRWSCNASSVQLPDAANEMLMLPERGQLAVALYKLPQLLLLDAQTLKQAEQRDWLQYCVKLMLTDGMLLSWSRASDKEREQLEKTGDCEDFSRVVVSPLAGGPSRIIELPGVNLSHVEIYMPGRLLLGAHGHWDMVEGIIDGEPAGGMAFANGSLALLDIASGKATVLIHYKHGLISVDRDPDTGTLYIWDYAGSGPEQKASPELKLLRLE